MPATLAAALAIYVSLGEGIPYLILVLAVMATLADVLMRRTRFGAQLYAVGGNPEAARLSGISLSRVVFINFVIAGFFYGITGVALTARVSGAIGGTAGLFLELDAIAAAVIGGTSLAGGPRPDPRCAARSDVDGRAEQRHEPDEHRHLLPTDGAGVGPAAGRGDRPVEPTGHRVDALITGPMLMESYRRG